METMGISRILTLILFIQVVVASNIDINDSNGFDNLSTTETSISNSNDNNNRSNSSDRAAKALYFPYRRISVPTSHGKQVSNYNPNYPLKRGGAKSEHNNVYKHYEMPHNHHVTRSTPLVLNVGDSYPPYTSRENIKTPYGSQRHFNNFYDASGYNILSENPMSSFLIQKPPYSGEYGKLFSPTANNYNTLNLPTSYPSKPDKKNFNFTQFNPRQVSGNNVFADQYPKTYGDIKSHSPPPTFSPGLISPGGFKPINFPQFQSNPQVSERVRIFDTEPKTIYSTSFDNPSIRASAVENFRTHPTVVNTPTNAYRNPKPKISGNYQLLSSQPQLLFHGPVTQQKQPVYHVHPNERIRTDVEIIKKPQRPSSTTGGGNTDNEDSNSWNGDDNTSFDTGFKGYHDHSFSDESKEDKLSTSKSNNNDNFNSPFFSSYDKSFGKHSAKTNPKHSTTSKPNIVEKPESPPVHKHHPIKHVYEHHDPEDYSSASSYDGYEAQDGSENHYKKAQEKKPKNNKETEEISSYESNENLPHHKSYQHDFTDEFENAYKRNLPKNEYVHVKEVPEIDESEYKSKIVSVSIKNPKKTVSRSHEVVQSKPTAQPYYIYSPPRTSTDYTASSDEQEEKTTELIPEISFGYKIPKQKSQSNDSDRVTEASPKQIDETQTKRRFSSRTSVKN